MTILQYSIQWLRWIIEWNILGFRVAASHPIFDIQSLLDMRRKGQKQRMKSHITRSEPREVNADQWWDLGRRRFSSFTFTTALGPLISLFNVPCACAAQAPNELTWHLPWSPDLVGPENGEKPLGIIRGIYSIWTPVQSQTVLPRVLKSINLGQRKAGYKLWHELLASL